MKECKCVNIEKGSYDNQVMLELPPHMKGYGERNDTKNICVDTCIVEDILELWEHEITTYGCCCGHGEGDGFINVKPSDFQKAISLGYTKYIFPESLGGVSREDTVNWPRSRSIL